METALYQIQYIIIIIIIIHCEDTEEIWWRLASDKKRISERSVFSVRPIWIPRTRNIWNESIDAKDLREMCQIWWRPGHRTDLKINCPPVPHWCVEVVFNPVQYFKVRKDQTMEKKGWTGFRFGIGYNYDRRTQLGLTETKWELSLHSG